MDNAVKLTMTIDGFISDLEYYSKEFESAYNRKPVMIDELEVYIKSRKNRMVSSKRLKSISWLCPKK